MLRFDAVCERRLQHAKQRKTMINNLCTAQTHQISSRRYQHSTKYYKIAHQQFRRRRSLTNTKNNKYQQLCSSGAKTIGSIPVKPPIFRRRNVHTSGGHRRTEKHINQTTDTNILGNVRQARRNATHTIVQQNESTQVDGSWNN